MNIGFYVGVKVKNPAGAGLFTSIFLEACLGEAFAFFVD